MYVFEISCRVRYSDGKVDVKFYVCGKLKRKWIKNVGELEKRDCYGNRVKFAFPAITVTTVGVSNVELIYRATRMEVYSAGSVLSAKLSRK